MKKYISLLVGLSFSLLYAESGYVCETNENYKEYANGERENIPKDSLYNSNTSCTNDCKSYSTCINYTTDLLKTEIFKMSGYINENQKDNIEKSLDKTSYSFSVKKDGILYNENIPGGYNFNGWIAPIKDPTLSTPNITTAYTYGDIQLTWNKFLIIDTGVSSSYTGSKINKSELNSLFNKAIPGIKNNGIYAIEIDSDKFLIKNADSKKIPKIPGTILNDGSNYIESVDQNGTLVLKYKIRGQEHEIFNEDDTQQHTINLIGDVYTKAKAYSLDIKIGNKDIPMEVGSYTDIFGQKQVHSYSLSLGNVYSGYKCSDFGIDVDISGDIKGNLFSNKNKCNTNCFIQNSCVKYSPGNCKMVDSEEFNPVTDYTGKTIFTKKTFNWSCEKKTENVVGCKKWEYSTIEGNVTYGGYNPGQNDLDFSNNFSEALGAATIPENAAHIWSGWAGYCEDGILNDDSWMSDPMQLLSLAMMAYTGALQGGYGEAAQAAAKSGTQAALNASEQAVDWGNDIGVVSDDAMFSATDSLWSASESISEMGTATSSIYTGASSISDVLSRSVNYVTSASNTQLLEWAAGAATIAAPLFAEVDDADVKNADNYMKASLGQGTADQGAVDYANCMSSIGLSFVNLSASAVDSNNTSEELKAPYMHPARLTYNQFTSLQVLTAQKNIDVKENYLVTKVGKDMITILPYSKEALQTIGQSICEPLKTAVIMNSKTNQAADKNKPNKAAAAASAAAGMAIGMLPPPYNLVGSVIFKVFTSTSSGNACHNTELAQKWGLIQAKTNKALKGRQCHLQNRKCAAKWVWGSCMRHRSNYCCFDQDTTRIFVESVKEQLNKSWDKCNDISIYDLQNVTFRECKANETPSKNKCISVSKYNELTQALTGRATKNLNSDKLTKQAVQGLQLPGGKSPWDE